MAGESAFLSQMLRQQAAAEGRGQMVKDAIAGQAASQIMRQIAMGEVQREMAREAQTGRALESAAGRQAQRDVGKSRMETQKELEEKQKLLGLIGGAAEATGALGGYMISQNALEEAQFKARVEKAALNPEVDDMSQFNPQDVEALQAMSQEQTLADNAPLMFDEGAVPSEDELMSAMAAPDQSFPRDAGSYETDVIRGMVDPRRGMPLTPEEQIAKEEKDRQIRDQLRAVRRFQGTIGTAPANPYSE